MLELKKLRISLLQKQDIITCKNIISFFDDPQDYMIESACNQVNDTENAEKLELVLRLLIEQYMDDYKLYNSQVVYGQKIIWSEIVSCFEAVLDITKRLENQACILYKENYLKACEQVNKLCEYYAKSQARLSKLEDVLGVDRYLDKVSEEDFLPLEELLKDQREQLERLCYEYKYLFQKKWSTTNISDIIAHKLIKYNGDNQICTLLNSKQRRVLLFIVDGFGFCQYLWHKELDRDTIRFTYKENIFAWLESVNCCKEQILGSAFITDTSAGLAQIFSGKTARDTGIISSRLLKNGDTNFFETKKLPVHIFEQYFNISCNSITDVIQTFGVESKVFYCTKFTSGNMGFSKYIFKNADIESIVPSERVFSVIKDYLDQNESFGLHVIYLTGIDNSGHTMGAYSKFEKFEHEKLNSLFRNFLIELASGRPDLFDGTTSILFTADHGMAESARIMANRFEILDKLKAASIYDAKLIENNRALLLYGISKEDFEQAKMVVNQYFYNLGIAIDILVKGETIYNAFFCSDEGNKIEQLSPDLVVRMIGNGLLYSKPSLNPHLMHYGGHGGASVGEVFVPLLDITLNQNLLDSLNRRFTDIL